MATDTAPPPAAGLLAVTTQERTDVAVAEVPVTPKAARLGPVLTCCPG